MDTERRYTYLDHHSTTPVDPRVLEAMLPYFTEIYGNAASTDHDAGHLAAQAVERARQQIAKVINARADEIVFTSGATESDNIALFGIAERYADKGDHIITCVTEHKAVLDCCHRLEQMGKQVTYLPVDQNGLVDPDGIRKAITPRTVLISIMFANNEIGTIAPIKEIGAIAREHGVFFHTDAAQAVGHVPVDVEAMNIDMMSFSAHKMYGPKGIGALYVRSRRPRVKPSAVIFGGGHERGMRSGTLNVSGIVGLGAALELASELMDEDAARYRSWNRLILKELHQRLGDVELNGHPVLRLPHNLSLFLRGVESKTLVVTLKNIALSTGSACTSASVEPSHVIKALGYGEQRAYRSIRIGVGRNNTDNEISQVISTLADCVRKIRQLHQ